MHTAAIGLANTYHQQEIKITFVKNGYEKENFSQNGFEVMAIYTDGSVLKKVKLINSNEDECITRSNEIELDGMFLLSAIKLAQQPENREMDWEKAKEDF